MVVSLGITGLRKYLNRVEPATTSGFDIAALTLGSAAILWDGIFEEVYVGSYLES
jgi:hypothetical protein